MNSEITSMNSMPFVRFGNMVFIMTAAGLVCSNVDPLIVLPNYTVMFYEGHYYHLYPGYLAQMQCHEVAAFLAHVGSNLPYLVNGLYYYLPTSDQHDNKSVEAHQMGSIEPPQIESPERLLSEDIASSETGEDIASSETGEDIASSEFCGKVSEDIESKVIKDDVQTDNRLSYASALKTTGATLKPLANKEQVEARLKCIYCSRLYNGKIGCDCIMARLHWGLQENNASGACDSSVVKKAVKKAVSEISCSNCFESGHLCNTGMCCNRCHLPGHIISECNCCAEPEHSNEPCLDWHLCPIVLAKTTCKICNGLGHFANTCSACRYCKGNCKGPVCAVYKAKQESRKIFQEKARVLMNPQVSDVARVVIKKGKKSQSDKKNSPGN